jgi:hypothetical protein
LGYDQGMTKRLVAIGFIFACTTAAWLILGGTLFSRTAASQTELNGKVASTWGAAQEQRPPIFTYVVHIPASGAVPAKDERHSIPIDSTTARVKIDLDRRLKGLLYYSTYRVGFHATYTLTNPTDEGRLIAAEWAFPGEKAVYDDLLFSVNGQPLTAITEDKKASASFTVPTHASASFEVGYGSQGLDSWRYNFGGDVSQVRNFKLSMATNFAEVDFPDNSLSPVAKQRVGGGWDLNWDYRSLISGYEIAVTMPEALQPGPLAGQISLFAPVSLFFFFFIMLVVTTLKRIDLHPVNYFFLAAAFFSFHLLLAYMVDHVSIHIAFVISSIVSVGLVTSYLRLAVGPSFAFREAAIAQLFYLVLFSYAFFFKGYTGLTITIGSILTLFVLMQATGRVRWSDSLSSLPTHENVATT